MAQHVQHVGSSQESGEVNFHEDWTNLAPSINEILREDHLKAAIESLDTDVNAAPLDLPDNLENYLELEDETNPLWMVPDVIEGNSVHTSENIGSTRKDSCIDQDGETDELNLSYNANSCSQVSLDAQENAEIHVTAAGLSSCDDDRINVAFQTKDREFEADSLRTKSSPINSIKCNKTQHKNLSNTPPENSPVEILNTNKEKEGELSCSAGRSEIIIQEANKSIDDSSDMCTVEKKKIRVTKSIAIEEDTHSEAPAKYKPLFGNKKRKLPLSVETDEKQSKVETATESIPATETCCVKVASAENDGSTIADETAVAEDNRASHSSTESISVETAGAAPISDTSKNDLATNEPKSTTAGNELLPISDKTAECNKQSKGQSKDKSSTCENATINESGQNSKATSESVPRKGKRSTSDCKLGKGKAKAVKQNQNSTITQNSSVEKEQNITGIKHFLEQQETLASARNLLRYENQRKESKSTGTSGAKARFDETFEDTTTSITYEDKLKTLDDEVSLLETLIEQVTSLTEGEEDHDKCLTLLGNIREKVSAPLLLKYPVLVAVFEPIQRYEIDERIKQEAEDIYGQFDSMYIKQNIEDFVFNFDRTLKFHHRRLSKSERLAQKILKRLSPNPEANTELTFDSEMWSNLAKERNSVWDRFVQEFRDSEKTTMFQAASCPSSQNSNVKEEVEEANEEVISAVLNTIIEEQQETEKSPQPSCSRSSRKASHSSLKSNHKKAETIVKPEPDVNNDVDVKPAINKLFVRIKEETVFNTEALTTNKELQRKQPARSCKLQDIKREPVSSDEPIIRIKQEIDCDTHIVTHIKRDMQEKQAQRSSKCITIKEEIISEIISGNDQIVRIKKEIDSDTDIQTTNEDFQRIQPRRSCKPNKRKLELRMHFAKRNSYFDKEKNRMSKKARVSSG